MTLELNNAGRIRNLKTVAKVLNAAHVKTAIGKYDQDSSLANDFGNSTTYDLIFEHKKYPPKAIFGLALGYAINEVIGPTHFTGGDKSECFAILRELGFTIKLKQARPIVFGDIEGYEVGHPFTDRKSMMENSFHRKWAAGIDGNGKDGTAAIVLSGGYKDDEDDGDVIIYTGAGGNENGKQVADQNWQNPGNAGLLLDWYEGKPVRVIRGAEHKSPHSPKEGYRYDGLYYVVSAWTERTEAKYKICRFRLEREAITPVEQVKESRPLDNSTTDKQRADYSGTRVVRDRKKAEDIKALYECKCQVCGIQIHKGAFYYAEAAHIRPVGRPHDGDDNLNNLLCLCPNHHVMFDRGIFSIADDFTLLGINGNLTVNPEHNINLENLAYHRAIYEFD